MNRILMVALLTILPAASWAFQPFTPVTDVCTTCPQPRADVLTLNDGTKLRGTIVGENTAFYAMMRHNEVRAVEKSGVQTVEYAAGSKPVSLGSMDQILLKSGHVLNGSITEDKAKPALFQLKSSTGSETFVVFKSEVSKVYRNGLEASF